MRGELGNETTKHCCNSELLTLLHNIVCSTLERIAYTDQPHEDTAVRIKLHAYIGMSLPFASTMYVWPENKRKAAKQLGLDLLTDE